MAVPAQAGEPDLQTLPAQYGGNRNQVARRLGISRTMLWRRLNAASAS